MQRRGYLTAVGSVGMIGSAGCSVSGKSQAVSNPTREQEDDGETHLHFDADGTHIATVTLRPGRKRYAGSGGDQVPLRVSISHRDKTTIGSLRLKLRTLPGGGRPPAEVALVTPWGTPHPDIQLYTDPEDAGTIFEVAEMGDQGSGTVTVEFLLRGVHESTTEVEVDATIGVTEDGPLGSSFRLEALTLLELPERSAS